LGITYTLLPRYGCWVWMLGFEIASHWMKLLSLQAAERAPCLLHNRVIWTPEVCHLGTYQCWVVLTFSWEPVEAKKIHFIFLIGSTMILYIYIYIHQWRCFYLETFWMEWNPKPNRRIVSYGEVVFFFLTPTWLDPSYWFFFFLPTPYLPPPSPFLLTIFPLQFPVFFLFSFVLFIVFLVISFFLSLCVCVCVKKEEL
jgi:hypothetical protein